MTLLFQANAISVVFKNVLELEVFQNKPRVDLLYTYIIRWMPLSRENVSNG